jgi:uncharacterized membrane protein
MDEGYTTLATKMLALHGQALLPSGLLYSCGTYCILSLPFVSILGVTPFAMRLIAVIAGIVLIPTVYVFAKRFFSLRTAYISTLFVTFSYFQIAWSRQARWYSLLELFSLLAVFFFLQTVHTKKAGQASLALPLSLSFLFSFLASVTHPTGLLIPLTLGIFAILHKEIRKAITDSFTRFLGLPRAIFSLTGMILGGFVLYRLFFFALDIQFFNLFGYYAYFYGEHYSFFIFFLLPLYVLLPQEKRPTVALLASIIVVYLLSLSYLSETLHYRYFFLVTPLMVILGSYGMTLLEKRRATLRVALPLLFLAFILLSSESTLVPKSFYALESDSPNKLILTDYYAYTPQPDWQEAYTYIKTNMTSRDVVISSHPHFTYLYLNTAGYWFTMDYLDTDSGTTTTSTSSDPYVSALPVQNIQELATHKHGYVVYDYQAHDGRIPDETLQYIHEHMTLVYIKETNTYSKIWVYKF